MPWCGLTAIKRVLAEVRIKIPILFPMHGRSRTDMYLDSKTDVFKT